MATKDVISVAGIFKNYYYAVFERKVVTIAKAVRGAKLEASAIDLCS